MENKRIAGMSALMIGFLLMAFSSARFETLNFFIATGFIAGLAVFIAGLFFAFGD